MNSRLKDIRKALRLTQKEFAARLGITDSGISRLEKGQNQLTDQLIRAICREYKVTRRQSSMNCVNSMIWMTSIGSCFRNI